MNISDPDKFGMDLKQIKEGKNMKKEYESPKAEKMDFDYREAVVASDNENALARLFESNCYNGNDGPNISNCRPKKKKK